MKKGDIVHHKLTNRKMIVIQIMGDYLLCKFIRDDGQTIVECFYKWEIMK